MQHINLYGQLDKYVEPAFSVRKQGLYLLAISAFMLLCYAVLQINSAARVKQLEAVQAQQQQVATKLSALEKKKQRLLEDQSLDHEIARLEQGVMFRREMLVSIDPGQAKSQQHFATHLSGLARQHIDGLWLNQIQFQQGGEQVVLQGKTRQPEYLPQFLKKLAAEPVFSGKQFKVLRMNVPEQWQGALNFEVRSVAAGDAP
jgi:hypothetical protein